MTNQVEDCHVVLRHGPFDGIRVNYKRHLNKIVLRCEYECVNNGVEYPAGTEASYLPTSYHIDGGECDYHFADTIEEGWG